jgi:hypothetical protein
VKGEIVMLKTFSIIFVVLSVFVFNTETQAQVTKSRNFNSNKFAASKTKSRRKLSNQSEKNEKGKSVKQDWVRSPFRYLIISNLTEKELELTIPQRRIEILMDRNAFNEKNLKLLLGFLKARFPLPIRLEIKLHTSLATIETPEEREMAGNFDPLVNEENYHKTALYIRFDESHENFSYAVGRPPGFWWKTIVLPKSK